MRKQVAILFLLMGVVLLRADGQTDMGRVRGKVLNEEKKPAELATVELLRMPDSLIFKTLKTSPDGTFGIQQIPGGNYCIRISSAGYHVLVTAVFPVGGTEVGLDTLTLRVRKVIMETATVRGQRPLVEVRPDRTIINVDAAIGNAGATALEILRRSPGITLDKDDNISLKGKQSVMVMLDGKPSYLSGADLAGLLGSMSAGQLDQIEIMTNPPAKYDAAGNAGIINIKTRKNRSGGFNGSVTLGYGQGKYWKTNNSLNLNYRNGRINVFLNYTSNASHGYSDLHIVRSYLAPDNKTVTAIFDQPTYQRRNVVNNTLKTGLDYYLSAKTTLGAVVSGFINPRNYYGVGAGYLEEANGQIDSVIHTISTSRNRVTNGAVNLNLHHSFDSTRELSVNADYVRYDSRNSQLYINTRNLPDGQLRDSNQLRGELPAVIGIWSGKADYSQLLGKGMKMDAGWKSSYVKTDNTADYYNSLGGDWQPDYAKTNHFIYRENINALYFNINREMGKWGLQAGLRFENTYYKGHQLGNPQRVDSSFDRHYDNLFPTANISYKVDGDNQVSVTASRRIDRPAYQDLNPFLFFINQVTYQQGNPFLRPQYTTGISVSHSFRNVLASSVSFSRTDPYFAQLFRTNKDTSIFGNYNVGRLDNLGLSVDAQLEPAGWWSVSLHTDVIYKRVDGAFSGDILKTEAVVALFNASNQLRFGKGWSGELSGYFNSRDLQDQFTTRPQGQVAVGVSKQVLGGKGMLKANMQDIFYTDYTNGTITYQNVREHFVQKTDTRVFNIAFTYRFGKAVKGPAHRNNGGAGDEQSRVKF